MNQDKASKARVFRGVRPIEGDWPYLWMDATYIKVRRAGRIVSVAVIIAVGINSDGRREVLGMAIGHSAAEVFDRQLKERGYLAMGGQIVDATLVAAPKQRNTQDEKGAIKEGKKAGEIWPDQPARRLESSGSFLRSSRQSIFRYGTT